jgi:hypothetical protein
MARQAFGGAGKIEEKGHSPLKHLPLRQRRSDWCGNRSFNYPWDRCHADGIASGSRSKRHSARLFAFRIRKGALLPFSPHKKCMPKGDAVRQTYHVSCEAWNLWGMHII